MQKKQLSYEMILEKSKSSGLPFSVLLGAAALEEAVRRISKSEYKDSLWLRNKNALGQEQYVKNLVLSLQYDYAIVPKKGEDMEESRILSDLAAGLKEKIFGENAEYGVLFSCQEGWQKGCLQLSLTARIQDMQVPITVKIDPLRDNHKIPDKETFSCIMFPEIAVSYHSYPTESFLAENFVEIITKLELIQNIGVYYDVFGLLGRESIDGRKVKDEIQKKCAGFQFSKEKSCLKIIEGYKDYAYMKKKWKAFLRSANVKEPSWEMALERFLKFFGPIFQAVEGDCIFFGDWMPDLNRFL